MIAAMSTTPADDAYLRNREIKRYCANFRPIRRILKRIGATRLNVRTQVDTFYRLPPGPGGEPRRLKLRIEDRRRQLIYYEDRYDAGLRSVRYQLADVHSSAVGPLLQAALGVSAVVRKRRERWHKGDTLFNLDTVEGLGTVFEVEVVLAPEDDPDAAVAAYLALFGPYLGEPILGSNEDLAGGR
jgi:adenylate cyclase class IV